MSKKHVDAYYKQVCEQYMQLKQEIKDFEKECSEGIVAPEKLDQLKQTLRPLMDNYQRISYIMYLFNLPNKKEKQKKYHKVNIKTLSKLDKKFSTEASIDENKNVLLNIDNMIKKS